MPDSYRTTRSLLRTRGAAPFLLVLLPLSGCVTSTMIRTAPSGASVSVNGTPIGTAPVEFRVPEDHWKPPYRYRIEKPGYQTAEGELTTIPATGRMTSAVFTLGIVAAIRPMSTFERSYTISLKPDPAGPQAAEPRSDSQDLETKLGDLQRLHKEGKITTPEYNREKARLLEDL